MTINRGVLFHRLIPYFLLLCFLVASAFIYLSSQTSTPAQAAWYNTGGTWLYRKPITIDHTKVSGVASSTLSSFPVLVSVTDTQLKSTSNGGLVASSTGADILFTKSDGTTLLDYEIESYASTTGQLIAWINIPILSAVTDTTIYEYFDNASAPAETPGNITGTWDTNYKGVWHLPNGTSLSGTDTITGGAGSLVNTPTSSTGQIDGSGHFVAASTQRITESSVSNVGFPVTISAWVKFTTVGNMGILSHNSGSNNGYRIQVNNPSNQLSFTLGGTNDYLFSSQAAFTTGSWYYVVVTVNHDASSGNGTAIEYLGSSGSLTNTSVSVGGLMSGTPSRINIGAALDGGTYSFNGDIDEVHISSLVRSADWIKTEYNNQSSPSTFYAYGAIGVQNRAAGTAGVAVVNRGPGIAWYNSSWSYRKPITIDHTKVSGVASSTLSSFPVLVSVTDTQLKSTSNGGLVASSTGADILFTKSDGTTLLDYEIESYASTTGQLIAWVNIPILSAVTDTTIYEYFGNASAPAETPGNITGTWDTNYKGVWHLKETTLTNGSTLYDSTSNANNATIYDNYGYPTATTGIIGGGLNLGAQGNPESARLSSITLSGAFTFSFWAQTASAYVDYKYAAGNSSVYFVAIGGTLMYVTNSTNTSYPGIAHGTITNGNWYKWDVVRDASQNTFFYKNGVSLGASPGTLTGNALLSALFDMAGGNYGIGGLADEYRISSTNRSADWIKTEYNNQCSPSTFYAYGALGANGRQSSSGAAVPAVRVRGGVKFH